MATALDLYAPFDDGSGANATEDTWRRIMRRLGSPGIVRNTLSEGRVWADSTGMNVKVDPLEAWIEGHWGMRESVTTLPISTAHGSLPRVDLVVVRADYAANRLELDVVAGTAASLPQPPDPPRNTSMFEVPIGLVYVGAGVVTLFPDDVKWLNIANGGNPTPTVSDDYALFHDKLSTVRRVDLDGSTSTTLENSQTRGFRMVPLREQTVSKLRYYPTTAAVGGSRTVSIYRGWSQSSLWKTSTFPMGNALPSTVGETTLPTPLTFMAGEHVVVAIYSTGTTTRQQLMSRNLGSGTSNLINPDTSNAYTTMFRTGDYTAPGSIDFTTAGGWTKSQQYPWIAFA
ncbi:hypothetical protein [Qaidamihabitans albus]|uniref:hypothetical protein n=1 Tax=Qaidamihabitans albus TaxID=2795733 RepID=UPI0018F1FC48|nr:hypothetical protein [Qaidamihabitans albus]